MQMYKSRCRRQALRLTAVLITLSLAGASLGIGPGTVVASDGYSWGSQPRTTQA